MNGLHRIAFLLWVVASLTTARAELTVHEWGTFTSVAGPDGKAAQWLPLAGPGDLPCFVERFQNRLFKDIGPFAKDIQKNPVATCLNWHVHS